MRRNISDSLRRCNTNPRRGPLSNFYCMRGMRLSEVARLKVTDAQLPARISKEPDNTGSVTILGKGRRTRIVTLNWKACKAIRRGTKLRVVQEVLGDGSLDTTSIYVSLAREEMDRELQENALYRCVTRVGPRVTV
jgi:site-specific recombinase XerD